MPSSRRLLLLASIALAAAAPARAQAIDPLDELLVIPRPGASMPIVPPGVPEIPAPFQPGQAPSPFAPPGSSPLGMGMPPNDALAPLPTAPDGLSAPTLGNGVLDPAAAPSDENVPFFEFTDEAPVTTGTTPEPIGTVAWPGQFTTPANEEPPLLGNGALDGVTASAGPDPSGDVGTPLEGTASQTPSMDSAQTGAPMGMPPTTPMPMLGTDGATDPTFRPMQGADEATATTTASAAPSAPPPSDPNAAFAFREASSSAPASPPPTGPALEGVAGTSAVGYRAATGGGDPTWNAQAQGLPVATADLGANAGDITLVLEPGAPLFWGITAGVGTRVRSIVIIGPQAPYAHIGVRSMVRATAPVVRRPDLDAAGVAALLASGGAGAITWK